MDKIKRKESLRRARHQRLRKRVQGTREQPRMCVHRSLKNFSVQLVDDVQGKVLAGMSTKSKAFSQELKKTGNVEAAGALGEKFAAVLREKGIEKVCFDRGGYLYHGRVKAFAEAARKGGIKF